MEARRHRDRAVEVAHERGTTRYAIDLYRTTGDLLGFGDNAPARVVEIFRQVLEVPSEDGVIFKPETLRPAAARAEDEYHDRSGRPAGVPRVSCVVVAPSCWRQAASPSRPAGMAGLSGR